MSNASDERAWTARLVTQDGKSIQGEAVDVSDDTLVVEFPREGGPSLQMAEQVRLRLDGSADLSIDVRTIYRAENLATVLYRFQMTGNVRPDLAAVFHGRRTFRVRPPANAPIRVTLCAQGSREEVVGETYDISRGGISVVLSEEGDAALCRCQHVRLRFELPRQQAPLEFAACIRRRALHGAAILYGLGFEEEGTADFEEQGDRVGRYALAQQVEMLKRAREERDAA